ncbi:MAG TPA: bifunctional oligoribonuclease/PAP phosphatase NrnA [Ktedonobacteraceae bacterium]|nr:bifunctional oligoribonuclease/PAP phosphatase NrnA [Ktedonobacteraceae bacterium]
MSPTNTTLDAQLDAALVQQALNLLAPARRIALLAHESPDGDCIGSALGLAHILTAMGKTCVPACADQPPKNLAFLPGIEMVVQDLGDEDFDLVIALDAGELRRFGDLYVRHRDFLDRARILNIDHHISSGGCGQVNIIDVGAAATAEVLVLLQQQAKLPLPTEAALCLLTGLITDTSSFQFTNTTPRCLEVAAELLRHGVITETVVQPIYRERSLAQARFQAAIIDHARTSCEGRLIWSWATADTLADAGATPEMDDNSSGMLRDIAGVQVAAFFKSYGEPDVTRLSLRSAAPYNAAEICQRLSSGLGGGHARAAGATFHQPIEATIQFVVAELEKELNKQSL